jgi:hypothetical protein
MATLACLTTFFITYLCARFGLLPALVGIGITALIGDKVLALAGARPGLTVEKYKTTYLLGYSMLEVLVALRSQSMEWRFARH